MENTAAERRGEERRGEHILREGASECEGCSSSLATTSLANFVAKKGKALDKIRSGTHHFEKEPETVHASLCGQLVGHPDTVKGHRRRRRPPAPFHPQAGATRDSEKLSSAPFIIDQG